MLSSKQAPTLTCYVNDNSRQFAPGRKNPAILIAPGGGYSNVCFTREGEPIAFHYLRAGFSAFVLTYSVAAGILSPAAAGGCGIHAVYSVSRGRMEYRRKQNSDQRLFCRRPSGSKPRGILAGSVYHRSVKSYRRRPASRCNDLRLSGDFSRSFLLPRWLHPECFRHHGPGFSAVQKDVAGISRNRKHAAGLHMAHCR